MTMMDIFFVGLMGVALALFIWIVECRARTNHLLNKRSIEQLLERIRADEESGASITAKLSNQVEKMQATIQSLCPHEDWDYADRKGLFTTHSRTCRLCSKWEYLTKAEYNSGQIEQEKKDLKKQQAELKAREVELAKAQKKEAKND